LKEGNANHEKFHKEVSMPNKDGTGPVGKGQRRRTRGPRNGSRGQRARVRHSPGDKRSGAGMVSGRRQGVGQKWQRNKNQ